MHSDDFVKDCQEQVRSAAGSGSTLSIQGNDTKAFLAPPAQATQTLNTSDYTGIVSYEPTELVVTAKAGTTIESLNQELASNGQMMPFEPPVFAKHDTLGGVIACGLSGPRRPYAGSARDFVLGTSVINGKGEHLRFGGEVMKNVAGYDVSRLQTGARGTLGIILDVSMKVLPLPEAEVTLVFEQALENDVTPQIKLARQPLPVSASVVIGQQRYVRLSGSQASIDASKKLLGGEVLGDCQSFWTSIKNLTHDFFKGDGDGQGAGNLWRISIADHAPALPLDGRWCLDWGGAQRWLITDADASDIFSACDAAGASAICYRHSDPTVTRYQPLTGVLLSLNQAVRQSFDPDGVFNPDHFHTETRH